MAFTVYGPGIRDTVTLDTLFQNKVVEEALASNAVRPVEGQEPREEAADEAAREKLARRQASEAYAAAAKARDRISAVYAHQVMSSPLVSLSPQTTILEAWRVFRERRFRHVPVAQAQNIVGIISDRDLLRYAALNGRRPPFAQDSAEANTTIQGLYKAKVLTATPDTEIRQIARVLFEQRIGAMPVVDDTGYPLGIITRSDILRTLISHAVLEIWA